jgi:hypothetical protein
MAARATTRRYQGWRGRWAVNHGMGKLAEKAITRVRTRYADRRACERTFRDPAQSCAAITIAKMAGRECYHCKQWIEQGEAHDCWTTTESALTEDLSEDLRDAWERLREAAAALGEQRIYASHKSIMFSRTSCYAFVRPKKSFLELCIFLGRAVKAPQVRRTDPASRTKIVHVIRITHRDQVESPITEWLREAYELSAVRGARAAATAASARAKKNRSVASRKR